MLNAVERGMVVSPLGFPMPISAELKLDAEVSVRKGISQELWVAEVWDGEYQSEIQDV